MPRNKCCPEPSAVAVGQAAFCLEWAQAAATPTANSVQNEQELLLGTAPISLAPTPRSRGCTLVPRPGA
eukprot:5065855-Pyramimonas_sp.AAC.1